MRISNGIRAAGIALGIGGLVTFGVIANMGQVTPGPPGMRFDCSPGERPEWDGDSWECRRSVGNDYRGLCFEFINECISAGVSSGEFTFATTGASAAVGSGTGGAGRPGMCHLSTGTTNTGMARIITGSSALALSTLASFEFEAVVGVADLSAGSEEYAHEYGFRSATNTVDQTNGCFLVYDRGNVATGGCNTSNLAKWGAFCCDNGTCTRALLDGSSQDGACGAGAIATVDSPVTAATLPNTGIDHLRIYGTPSAVNFEINGTLRATFTTNIPSTSDRTSGAGGGIFKSAGTTSRTSYLDVARLAFCIPAVRSP